MAANPGNDHWRQLEELFYAALDLDPADRAAFLDRSCGSNAEVRREVDVLLSSSEKTWGFFQKPLQAVAERVTMDSESDGPRLGDYKVIRQIGEGGMGKVYLAERADELYQQQVAIKLVQSGTGRTRDLLLRFTAERQILANLSHPNIARLLDAGIAYDGSPYLVMEYIEGVAMDKYATVHGLSIPERLKLFCIVCAAVEYAHRNLVVHRDIKPANILVTNEGVPKLLDFGIAKLLQPPEISDVNLTRATERLMTPEYGSPEQVRGEAITTTTDVYALGVLLYVLLTGQPPLKIDTRSPLEVARIVCEQMPTRPSSVLGARPAAVKNEARALRGDLDNIVLKALRKEPDRRYTSVGTLAEDVRRHLDGYPVQAAADSWRYRTRKFIGRHKASVTAAILMTLAIMGFSIGMGWFARRANRERAKAEQQQLRAEQESKFLSGLFQSATPDAERGKTITARDVLDLSVKRIDRELAGQPDVRASMLDSIGSSYVALGLYDQAQPLQEQAYSIRKKEFGNDNLDVAQSATSLALVMRAQGKFDQEEALLREALAVRQKLVGENNPLVGETLANLGECLYLQSRTQEAEPLLRKAIAVSRENSDVIAGARNYLALVLEKKGSYQEATRLLRSAAEISAGNEGTDSPSYLTAMHNLAGALSDLGNLSEAEATERKVLEIRQRVSGRDHPDTAYSLNMLGWILLEKGDWAAAEPYLKESLEIVRKTLGTKNPRLAVSLNNWARVLQGEGDYKEAENYYRQAFTVLQENRSAESWTAAKIETNLSLLQLDRGDGSGAERYAQQALALCRKLGGDNNPEVASALLDVGLARSFQGDLAGAETLLRQALEIREKVFSSGHFRIIAAQARLGEVLTAEGKLDESAPLLREAVEAVQNSPFPLEPWQVAEAESALGVCLAKLGQTTEARALIEKSTDALKTHPEAALRKQATDRAARVLAGEKQ
jgi:serine/threonine protein kinase/tetratricopeptide (TPR) repeat protein